MGRHAMIAVPSPVNLCALTIIPPASLYMTLAVKCLKGAQSRTRTRTPSPNRSLNRLHRIGSALGMGAEGPSAGGKGGMNPSKGEGSIPRCSLYRTTLNLFLKSLSTERRLRAGRTSIQHAMTIRVISVSFTSMHRSRRLEDRRNPRNYARRTARRREDA